MVFRSILHDFPFIAITRGIKPEEALTNAEILFSEGFRIIENPLNSPDPMATIATLSAAFAGRALIGAGTVTTAEEVRAVGDAGGALIISPNCDPEVIQATKKAGLISVPGVATPTEAFTALRAGADALKLFPAEIVSPAAVKAMRAVLPADVLLFPVGGINPNNWQVYKKAGAAGFGLGSSLYAKGIGPDQLQANSRAFAKSWQAYNSTS